MAYPQNNRRVRPLPRAITLFWVEEASLYIPGTRKSKHADGLTFNTCVIFYLLFIYSFIYTFIFIWMTSLFPIWGRRTLACSASRRSSPPTKQLSIGLLYCCTTNITVKARQHVSQSRSGFKTYYTCSIFPVIITITNIADLKMAKNGTAS